MGPGNESENRVDRQTADTVAGSDIDDSGCQTLGCGLRYAGGITLNFTPEKFRMESIFTLSEARFRSIASARSVSVMEDCFSAGANFFPFCPPSEPHDVMTAAAASTVARIYVNFMFKGL